MRPEPTRDPDDDESQVSERAWHSAQIAERNYASALDRVRTRTESRFFQEKIQLSPSFFVDKDILEIGCGPTSEIHYLGGTRLRVGIDPLANEWNHLYRNDTDHICGRGENLPFQDSCFDIVLCINTLDHVQSPVDVLEEIRRVLKKGGTLVLWIQTYSLPASIREKLTLVDFAHPHHFDDSEVLTMIMKTGFAMKSHSSRRVDLRSTIQYLSSGGRRLLVSGMKYLAAKIFLRLRESSYLLSPLQAHG